MSFPIQRQSDSYGVFDDGNLRFAKDYETKDLPEGLVNMLGGPRITAGMLNTRRADAWHSSDVDNWGWENEHRGADPDAEELSYRDPHMTDDYYAQPPTHGPDGYPVDDDPNAGYDTPVQPLDQFVEQQVHHPPSLAQEPPPTYLGQRTQDYDDQFSPHLASFTTAHAAERGPTPAANFTTTAAAVQPQIVPGWVGHGYAPGHRVGLPWREQVIPGTVTHLDGQQVGVRWDDGQHSSEEPADLRPL